MTMRSGLAKRALPRKLSVTLAMATAVVSLLSGCASLSDALGARHEPREFVMSTGWVRSTLKKEFLGYRRMNRMAPIVLEKLIIQANAIDGIMAFDRTSGQQAWRLDLENGVEGGAAVVGDRLYFGSSDGQFYCVNVTNGRVLWTFPVRAETLSAPTIDGGVVYFQNGADVVFALDAESGKQLWLYNRQATSNFSIRASTRPVVDGDRVFVGFSDGFLVALKKRDGSLAWERKLGKTGRFRDVDSTPVIDGDSLYVASFDGSLYSLKRESGDVNWEIDQGGYVPVTIGQGRFADRLYFATVGGQMLILDKHSGKELVRIQLNHGIPTQAVLYRNSIVYGESEGALVVADAETGATIGRFEPGHGLVARPTVVDASGEAYFISNSANLYAMRLKFERRSDLLPWQKSH
jgi:outer membrane protein assembly factor BamB